MNKARDEEPEALQHGSASRSESIIDVASPKSQLASSKSTPCTTDVNFDVASGAVAKKLDASEASVNKDDDDKSNKAKRKRKSPAKPWKKPPGMPKRPLSAYNLFYQAERERILGQNEKIGGGGKRARRDSSLEEDYHEESEGNLDESKEGLKKKSASGKKSGVGFGGLTKIISEKWNLLSDEEKDPYDKKAAVEKKRYDDEIAVWRQEVKKEKDEAKLAASLPLNIVDSSTPAESFVIDSDPSLMEMDPLLGNSVASVAGDNFEESHHQHLMLHMNEQEMVSRTSSSVVFDSQRHVRDLISSSRFDGVGENSTAYPSEWFETENVTSSRPREGDSINRFDPDSVEGAYGYTISALDPLDPMYHHLYEQQQTLFSVNARPLVTQTFPNSVRNIPSRSMESLRPTHHQDFSDTFFTQPQRQVHVQQQASSSSQRYESNLDFHHYQDYLRHEMQQQQSLQFQREQQHHRQIQLHRSDYREGSIGMSQHSARHEFLERSGHGRSRTVQNPRQISHFQPLYVSDSSGRDIQSRQRGKAQSSTMLSAPRTPQQQPMEPNEEVFSPLTPVFGLPLEQQLADTNVERPFLFSALDAQLPLQPETTELELSDAHRRDLMMLSMPTSIADTAMSRPGRRVGEQIIQPRRTRQTIFHDFESGNLGMTNTGSFPTNPYPVGRGGVVRRQILIPHRSASLSVLPSNQPREFEQNARDEEPRRYSASGRLTYHYPLNRIEQNRLTSSGTASHVVETNYGRMEAGFSDIQQGSVDNMGNISARRMDSFWEGGNHNENTVLEASHVATATIPAAGVAIAPQGTPHQRHAIETNPEQSMDQDSSPDSMFDTSLQSLSEKLDDEAIDFLTSINKQPRK